MSGFASLPANGLVSGGGGGGGIVSPLHAGNAAPANASGGGGITSLATAAANGAVHGAVKEAVDGAADDEVVISPLCGGKLNSRLDCRGRGGARGPKSLGGAAFCGETAGDAPLRELENEFENESSSRARFPASACIQAGTGGCRHGLGDKIFTPQGVCREGMAARWWGGTAARQVNKQAAVHRDRGASH